MSINSADISSGDKIVCVNNRQLVNSPGVYLTLFKAYTVRWVRREPYNVEVVVNDDSHSLCGFAFDRFITYSDFRRRKVEELIRNIRTKKKDI